MSNSMPPGYGDLDQYLEYTEGFDFSFDMNFSSFVPTANDEDMAMGLLYTPADALAENITSYTRWYDCQHFVGVVVSEDGNGAYFYMRGGNGGDIGGRGTSADITGVQSLATGTDYRFIGHYRFGLDAAVRTGQLYGKVLRNDGGTWVQAWALPVDTTIVYTDGDTHPTAWFDMFTDAGNRQFIKLKTLGIGNWTWGTTQNVAGPQFASDNWLLTGTNPIPEPGMIGMVSGFTAAILLKLRRNRNRKK